MPFQVILDLLQRLFLHTSVLEAYKLIQGDYNMKQITKRIIALLTIFCLIFAQLPVSVSAAASTLRLAKITAIDGPVKVFKGGGSKAFTAFKGMSMSEGDKLVTGIGGSVTFDLEDDKVITVSQNTQLMLSELVKDVKGNTDTSMNLMGGKVLCNIKKKLTQDSSFEIKTPTAVMGVRGTMFFVGQEEGRTDVAVLEGTVTATTYIPPQENDGGAGGTQQPQQQIETLINANEQVTLEPEVLAQQPSPEVRVEQVTTESLDLMVLESIVEDPSRVDQSLLENIDQVIEQRQVEQQQQIEEQLQQQQQSQQQVLQQQTVYNETVVPEAVAAALTQGVSMDSMLGLLDNTVAPPAANIFNNVVLPQGIVVPPAPPVVVQPAPLLPVVVPPTPPPAPIIAPPTPPVVVVPPSENSGGNRRVVVNVASTAAITTSGSVSFTYSPINTTFTATSGDLNVAEIMNVTASNGIGYIGIYGKSTGTTTITLTGICSGYATKISTIQVSITILSSEQQAILAVNNSTSNSSMGTILLENGSTLGLSGMYFDYYREALPSEKVALVNASIQNNKPYADILALKQAFNSAVATAAVEYAEGMQQANQASIANEIVSSLTAGAVKDSLTARMTVVNAAVAAGLKYSITDSKVTITDYIGAGGNITLPSALGSYPITKIGTLAFGANNNITNITIPNSVIQIDSSAFMDCTELLSINIPSSVLTMGNSMFFGCAKLTSATIPSQVTIIGNSFFYGCSALSSVTFLGNVTSFGYSVFSGCTSLVELAIPESLQTMGTGVFSACTGLTSVALPSGITSISNMTFYNCSNLNSVIIQGTITSIGEMAFTGCTSLSYFTIPDTVTSIGQRAFYGCTSLSSMNIPNLVQTIGIYVFNGCSNLTSVTIGTGISSIPEGTFYDCSSLQSINIPSNITSVGNFGFRGCSSLATITIDAGLQTIGTESFRGTTITSISLPNTLTTIGQAAFYGCTNLSSITVPNSVTSAGGLALAGCTGITSIIMQRADTTLGDNFINSNFFRTVYLAGGIGTYNGTYGGSYWGKPVADGTQVTEELLLNTYTPNIIVNNGQMPSFTTTVPYAITYIDTYHYLDTSSTAATITLKKSDGTLYGLWKAVIGTNAPLMFVNNMKPSLQGTYEGTTLNTLSANSQYTIIPIGNYTVIDSKPETWSTDGYTTVFGFTCLKGYKAGGTINTVAEKAAIATINSASTGDIQSILSTNKTLLGLDITYQNNINYYDKYAALSGSSLTSVNSAMTGKSFITVADVKNAFMLSLANIAVQKAESTRLSADIADANKYLYNIPTGTAKTGLINRVASIVALIPITAIADIGGTQQVGATLTIGALTPAATASYQWKIADSVGGTYTDISGATNSSYLIKAVDVGKFIKVVATGTVNYCDSVTSNATSAIAAKTISNAVIAGVTLPVEGATPVTVATATDEYTATVTWSPTVSQFINVVYTATITLTPKTGYTTTGIAENFFSVAGATSVTNAVDSGVVAAVFPAIISSACTLIGVTTPSGANISGSNITSSVVNSMSSFTVDLSVSPDATWKIFSDSGYTTEISKTISPLLGDNLYYIKVIAQNGTSYNNYTLSLRRLSNDAVVTGASYTINDSANTIVGTPTVINSNVTVAAFLSNLTKNTLASWKVVLAGTNISNSTEFDAATAKGTTETMVLGDNLAVKAEDGTIKIYTVSVVLGNPVAGGGSYPGTPSGMKSYVSGFTWGLYRYWLYDDYNNLDHIFVVAFDKNNNIVQQWTLHYGRYSIAISIDFGNSTFIITTEQPTNGGIPVQPWNNFLIPQNP